MPSYRVTKYDPAIRNSGHRYDEWTSRCDIGKSFGGTTFTEAEYLRTEGMYIDAVERFMLAAHVGELVVRDLESFDVTEGLLPAPTEPMIKLLRDLRSGATVAGDALQLVIRLALREMCWARLECGDRFGVCFGYDYYMYIDVKSESFTPPAAPPGIYVEQARNPYAPNSTEE